MLNEKDERKSYHCHREIHKLFVNYHKSKSINLSSLMHMSKTNSEGSSSGSKSSQKKNENRFNEAYSCALTYSCKTANVSLASASAKLYFQTDSE